MCPSSQNDTVPTISGSSDGSTASDKPVRTLTFDLFLNLESARAASEVLGSMVYTIEAVRAKNLVVSPRKVPDSIQMPSRYP